MGSQTRPQPGRRVAAAVAALTMAGVGAALAPPAEAHETPVLPPGDYTEEQQRFAEDLVHRTEVALPAKYSDASTLEALGFYDFGGVAPGGYHHFINPGWMGDDHLLDPEFPESLVYQDTGSGLNLVAAMFYLRPEHTMGNIPEEYAWLPGWHIHQELCVDENGQFTGIVDQEGNCAFGHVSESPPMMHVWVVDNDCGHRFPGVGVGGLMCGDHGHGPGPTYPGPHPHPTDPGPTTPPPSDTTTTTTVDDTTTTTTVDDTTTTTVGQTTTTTSAPDRTTTTVDRDPDRPHNPPPARPVAGEPDYTG